jgi:hypothetical protein
MPEIHGFIICEDVQQTQSHRWSAVGIVSHFNELELQQPIDLAAYCHLSKIPGKGVYLSVQIRNVDSDEIVWEMANTMRAPPEGIVETRWEGKIPLRQIPFPLPSAEAPIIYCKAVLFADGKAVAESHDWSIG